MTSLFRFEQHVETTIRSRSMLCHGDRIIVAVSGGPDSVTLLSVLASLRLSWGLHLMVVHFNHGLRGRESTEDAEFVKDLCEQLGVDVVVKHLNFPQALREKPASSLQQQAREARYEALFHMAEEWVATKIAIGHTADDQAETVLMWMIRGSGTGGLSGIPAVRHPYVIRPLLETSREEILSYLTLRKLNFRTDSSNGKPMYFRNQIRNELIPMLQSYNPNLINALSRQADIVREDHTYLEEVATNALAESKRKASFGLLNLQRGYLTTLPLAIRRRVIRLALQSLVGVRTWPSFDAVERVLAQVIDGQSGSEVGLYGIRIRRDYDNILFEAEKSGPSCSERSTMTTQTVSIPSQSIWPLTGQTLNVSLGSASEENHIISPLQAKLDAETFSPDLVLRTWEPGDKFYPLGLEGKRKKIQDFFSDIKLERAKRKTIPILVAPEGILWVGGYRIDHRFQVTAATRKVLTASLSLESS